MVWHSLRCQIPRTCWCGTVTTMDPHGFEAEIVTCCLAFTCLGSTGMTTISQILNSLTVDSITEQCRTSRTFTTFLADLLICSHIQSRHSLLFRSKAESITDNNGTKYTPTTAEYMEDWQLVSLYLHGLTTSNTVSIATF